MGRLMSPKTLDKPCAKTIMTTGAQRELGLRGRGSGQSLELLRNCRVT